MPRWRNFTFPVLILPLALALWCFRTSLGSPFHFDDALFLESPQVTEPGDPWYLLSPAQSRPLTYLTFYWNYRLGGRSPSGYHAVNLALHLACVLGVCWFAALLLRRGAWHSDPQMRRWLPVLAAGIFALHPVQTEAVNYIYQRSTLLAALFALLSMGCFLRAGQSSRAGAWYALSGLAMCSAVASKESAVVLPLIWPALAWCESGNERLAPGSGRRRRGLWMGAVPAALCVVWVAYSLWSRSAGTDIPAQASRALAYLTAQAQVFATYARMLVLPAGLSVDHDFRPAPAASLYFVLCLMELAGFLAIAVVARRRLPLLSFLVLMFFILLAPTSSIVPSGDLLFEHRLYLPMIPFAIVAAWGILAAVRRLFASGRLRIAVSCLCGCLLLGALAEASRRRTYVWGDGVRLWSDAVAKAPRKARTHYNLAIAYLDRDRQAARRELLATLELEPRHAPALYNLGRIAQSEQSYDAAAGWYRRAIRADPGTWQAHHNLGNLETLKGNAGEAMREFEEAIRLRPDDWPAYLNLAGLQAQGRDFPAALRTLGILKNVRWDLPEARYLNAYILASQARYGEAESELRFIEEHDPQGNYRTRIRELRGRFPAGASR